MSKPSKSQPVVVARGDGTFYSSHRVRPHPAPAWSDDYDTRAQPPTQRAVNLFADQQARESRRQRRLQQQRAQS